jgi:hypothetical protein
LEHARIPISARLYSGVAWVDGMMLASIRREFCTLSHR